MITVLGMWEAGWMEAERTERRLWKQTIQAFAVDRWAMAPVQGGPFTSPVQYDTAERMLAAHPGPKTFLVPASSFEGSIDLKDYRHPENGIYVFGNAPQSMVEFVQPGDDVVSLYTAAGRQQSANTFEELLQGPTVRSSPSPATRPLEPCPSPMSTACSRTVSFSKSFPNSILTR